MSGERMTIREVANALGYDVSSITKKVRELFPELMRNGKTTFLNEPQVTAVKLKLGKNSELALKPKTDLEKEKRMTLKELAAITGASYRTVADYVRRAGWTENGKQTLLNEMQVTAVLEAMKATQGQGQSRALQDNLQGMETPLSLDLQIALIEKQAKEAEKRAKELWKRKALEEEARAQRAEKELSNERRDHNATKHLLADREIGLEHIQRIVEAGGLMTSDREDMFSLYRREK